MILLTSECPKSTSVKCLFILMINQITCSSVKHYGLVNHFQSSDQDHLFSLHWICGEMHLIFLFYVYVFILKHSNLDLVVINPLLVDHAVRLLWVSLLGSFRDLDWLFVV